VTYEASAHPDRQSRQAWWALALVGLLAFVNFGIGLGDPSGAIWDEAYYLTSTERYSHGMAQFASHPPLGLMLIAAGDRLEGSNRQLDTRALGRVKSAEGTVLPPGFSFVPVRIASGVFATLGAMLFLGLMYSLTRSTFSALVFSNLYTFENAFVTQFRAAQLDGFQIVFTLSALLFFVKSLQKGHVSARLLDVGLGVSCGLAMMVKLNSAVLLLLGMMLIVRRTAFYWIRVPSCVPLWPARYRLLGNAVRDGACMLGACLAAMVAVFTVHLLVCSHEVDAGSAAGKRDQVFLSAPYRDYLEGKRSLTPEVFLSAARDYSRFITADFEGVPHADTNGSTPIEWLRGGGTINYRWDSDGIRTAYVQLVGNPVGSLLALAAPCALIGLLLWPHRSPTRALNPMRRSLMWMLLIEWLAFMVLHEYLSTLRVMYLYHYFIGLVLAFVMLPLIFEEAADRWPSFERRRDLLLGGLTAALLTSFIFYAPLNFHRPLTHDECELRNALQHVVNCL